MKFTVILVANEHNPCLAAGLAINALTFHLRRTPKALLPSWKVGSCVLDLWWDEIKSASTSIADTYLVVNASEYTAFSVWASLAGFPSENVINDGSSLPCNNVGTLGAVDVAVRTKNITGPVAVIGADTLLPPTDSFDLTAIIQYYHSVNPQRQRPTTDVVLMRPLPLSPVVTSTAVGDATSPVGPSDTPVAAALERLGIPDASPSFILQPSAPSLDAFGLRALSSVSDSIAGQAGGSNTGLVPTNELDVVAARALSGPGDRTHVRRVTFCPTSRAIASVDAVGRARGAVWWPQGAAVGGGGTGTPPRSPSPSPSRVATADGSLTVIPAAPAAAAACSTSTPHTSGHATEPAGASAATPLLPLPPASRASAPGAASPSFAPSPTPKDKAPTPIRADSTADAAAYPLAPQSVAVGVLGGVALLTAATVAALQADAVAAVRVFGSSAVAQMRRFRNQSSRPVGRSSETAIIAAPQTADAYVRAVRSVDPFVASSVGGDFAGTGDITATPERTAATASGAAALGGANGRRSNSTSNLGSYIVPDGGSMDGVPALDATPPAPAVSGLSSSALRVQSPQSSRLAVHPAAAGASLFADGAGRAGLPGAADADGADDQASAGDVLLGTSWDDLVRLGPQVAARGVYGPNVAAFVERHVAVRGAPVRAFVPPTPLLLVGQTTLPEYLAAVAACIAVDAVKVRRPHAAGLAGGACHDAIAATASLAEVVLSLTNPVNLTPAVAAGAPACATAGGGVSGPAGGPLLSGTIGVPPRGAPKSLYARIDPDAIGARMTALLGTAGPAGRPTPAPSGLVTVASTMTLAFRGRAAATASAAGGSAGGPSQTISAIQGSVGSPPPSHRRNSGSATVGDAAPVAPRSISPGEPAVSPVVADARAVDALARRAGEAVAAALSATPTSTLGCVTQRAYARVGLLGNPSDGFGGQTLSVAIQNFYAEVALIPRSDGAINFVPSPLHDRAMFANADAMIEAVTNDGFDGGVRLLQAAARVFFSYARERGLALRRVGCDVTYDTTIPRRVGLAGSSAIVTCMFKALMQLHNVPIAPEGIPIQVLPSLILSVERDYLGISAGLQDRVAQVYDTLVEMDFSVGDATYPRAGGLFKPLPVSLLPPGLWLAWAPAGSDSGRAHNNVRQRFESGDQAVIAGMRQIASLVPQGVRKLEASVHDPSASASALGSLMCENQRLRVALYTEAAMETSTREMLAIAAAHNVPAKLPGSGCAVIVVPTTSSGRPSGWPSRAQGMPSLTSSPATAPTRELGAESSAFKQGVLPSRFGTDYPTSGDIWQQHTHGMYHSCPKQPYQHTILR